MSKKLVWIGLLVPGLAVGALNDLGSGVVRDTSLNIEWLQDANMVKTSCNAGDALWQAFDLQGISNSTARTKREICDDNGRLNWYEAQAWIVLLNSQNYLGSSGWRLPDTPQPDAGCISIISGQSYGYHCTASEMANLFNVSLDNPNRRDDSCYTGTPPNCLQNSGPFRAIQGDEYSYWSQTLYAPNPVSAWKFDFARGSSSTASRAGRVHYVWPVRAVSERAGVETRAIPAIGAAGLVILGLMLALFGGRGRR